jgi:hypothetical protein
VQQESKLVGKETTAAQAVGRQGAFEVLYAVLGLATTDVPIVEFLGLLGSAGEHEARVGALLQMPLVGLIVVRTTHTASLPHTDCASMDYSPECVEGNSLLKKSELS